MSIKTIGILIVIYLIIAFFTLSFFNQHEQDENGNYLDKRGNIVVLSQFEETILVIGSVITLLPLIPVFRWIINEWFSWRVAARIARWIDEK